MLSIPPSFASEVETRFLYRATTDLFNCKRTRDNVCYLSGSRGRIQTYIVLAQNEGTYQLVDSGIYYQTISNGGSTRVRFGTSLVKSQVCKSNNTLDPFGGSRKI